MKKFHFTLALVFLTSSCCALSQRTTHTISFRGTAEIKAIPDLATFNITVRVEDKTVLAAQQKMTEKTNKALALFKAKGVESKDIQTTNYNSNPKYTYHQDPCQKNICPPGKNLLTGYEASQTISLKLRDTTKAGEILTAIAALGIAEVSGPAFSIENNEKYRAQAQAEAIAKAKAEALSTAQNLGITLKKIVNFSEEPRGFEPRMMLAKSMAFESMQSAMPQLEAGEQKVVSAVVITYEIE